MTRRILRNPVRWLCLRFCRTTPRNLFAVAAAFFLLPCLHAAASPDLPAAKRAELTGINPKSEWYGRLFELAKSRSPEIRSAQELAIQKGAAWWTAVTRWLPRADVQLGVSNSKDYTFITSGALGSLATSGMDLTPKAMTLGRWALNFAIPVYKRSTHLNLTLANLDSKNAELILADRIADLDWRLRTAAGNYLTQVYREQAVQKSIELGETHLRETKIRVDLGQKTKIDLLRSQANLSNWIARRLTHKNARETDRHTLMDLAGISESEWRELEAAAPFRSVEQTGLEIEKFAELAGAKQLADPLIEKYEDPKMLEDRVAQHAPRFLQATRDGAYAQAQSKQLMALEWPELNAQVGLNKQSDTFSKLVETDNVSYQVSIVLSIPLFSFGSFFSTWRESGAAGRVAELRQDREKQRVLSEVSALRHQLVTLIQTDRTTELQLNQQTEILRLTQTSYELGRAGILELLTAQNDLLETRINWAKTKVDLSVALRRFLWELGV